MRLEDGKIGQRILSRSDGFTRGWIGAISSMVRHADADHRDAFIVLWDNGQEIAVACDLVEPVVIS